MSRYTTTINEILNSYLTDYQKEMDLSSVDIVNLTKQKFFNFHFPWYTSVGDTLDDFERMFLLTYYNDYIGFETLGMWKTYFSARMERVMPHYKKLYDAMRAGDNPFINNDRWITRDDVGEQEENVKNTNTSDSKNDYQSIDSDNPQVTVSDNDYASAMSRGENIGKTEQTGEGTSKRNEKRNEKTHESSLTGKSRAQVIDEYKKQIVNINNELVRMCSTLFLGVW